MLGRMYRAILVLAIGVAAFAAEHPVVALLRSKCGACHGAQGEGNLALHAPKLSGQSDWYLKRQLKYYKQGVRGTHEKDVFGKVMAPMAATLVDDAAIGNVTHI